MRKDTSTNSANEIFLMGLCPLQQSIHLLKGRWTAAILFGIANGKNHFGMLGSEFPKLSKKVLADRVMHLENSGLITKTCISQKPLSIKYHLTPIGKELIDVISPLDNWGKKWLEKIVNH
jgi:DNA-binding HxlR family transcriptional regulator